MPGPFLDITASKLGFFSYKIENKSQFVWFAICPDTAASKLAFFIIRLRINRNL